MNTRRQELLNNIAIGAFERGQKWFLTDVRTAERRGEKLGNLLFKLDRKHRERTRDNLAMAFPSWTPQECELKARQVFQHWGRITGDFLRTPVRTNEELLDSMEVEGAEWMKKAEEPGVGIIACTAHLGNFERFGHWCTATGRPISVVAREANQSGIQERLSKLRDQSKFEVLSRGDSARTILARLRSGGLVGILPDQNASESFVPFFGKPCGTVLGPAVLGIRTGAILLPAFCVRLGVGQYRCILKAPLKVGDRKSDPQEVMAEFNGVLESVIRDYPEQYLWMHDRWKSARQRGMLG